MIGALVASLALAAMPQAGSHATLGPWTTKPIAYARIVQCTVVTWQLGPGEFNSITLACNGKPQGIPIRITSETPRITCLARGWGVGYAIEGWLVFNGERCSNEVSP